MGLEFAVFDAETTGFFPEKDDRLVELAVLRLDSRGKILRAFHTVIDPCRSLPPCRTHSLTEDDIKEAPKFGEIAGDVVDFLAEAVIISHNVIFNRLFIKEEFERLGHALPAIPSICTLELARQLVPEPRSRRLPDVCLELGLSYGGRHNALEEARATRLVFLQALNQLQIKSVKDLGITGTPPPRSAWPAITPSGRYTQQPSPPEKPPAQSTAPPPPTRPPSAPKPAQPPLSGNLCTPAQDQYLILLDQILEDRIITAEETNAMDNMAREHHLTRDQIYRAHRIYLKELFIAAWRDGKVTPGEKKDLEEVRKLLSLSLQDYANLMEEAKRESAADKPPADFVASREKIRGMAVCIAGSPKCKVRGMVPSALFAQSLATEAGLVVHNQLGHNVDFLVVSDPEESASEIESAQEMGVRVLAEPVFWRMIEIDIQ